MVEEENHGSSKWYDYLNDIKDVISDFGAFIIVLIVVIAFIHITLVAVYAKNFNFENFKDIAAIYGVWLGSMIGYFFGSRQVEALSKRVSELLYDLDFETDEAENKLKTTEEKLTKYSDLYTSYKSELQFIVCKYRNNIEKEDLERLKSDYGIRV